MITYQTLLCVTTVWTLNGFCRFFKCVAFSDLAICADEERLPTFTLEVSPWWPSDDGLALWSRSGSVNPSVGFRTTGLSEQLDFVMCKPRCRSQRIDDCSQIHPGSQFMLSQHLVALKLENQTSLPLLATKNPCNKFSQSYPNSETPCWTESSGYQQPRQLLACLRSLTCRMVIFSRETMWLLLTRLRFILFRY